MVEKVDHPSHYNTGKIECIEIIEDIGIHWGFCVGNAIKYLYRANNELKENSHPLEDLKKARWYIDRLIKTEWGPDA